MTTVIGFSLAGLVAGALYTETVLGIPGIGSFIYESITNRDYNVILAIVLITATAFVMVNLLVDVLLIIIDPRIRATGGRNR
jgi:peptide/nickel transport system permease protein